MDEPIFSMSQIARATGVSAGTLKSWLDRGIIKMSEDDGDIESEGRGKHRRGTLRRALMVGAMARLVEARVSPSEAAGAAEIWTHHNRVPKPGIDSRVPAAVFGGDSFTVLRLFADGYADVMELKRGTPATDLYVHPLGGMRAGVVSVILNFVDKDVRTALSGSSPPPSLNLGRRSTADKKAEA